MLPQLKPEILLVIFEHLRRPLPRPHSDLGSDRSIIRQPDLLAAIKVSKEWYNLAALQLYRVVITDNLELFLYREEIQISDIIPKSTLLGLVKHLYIEYGKKDGIVPRERDWVVKKVFKGMKGDSPGRWDPPRLGLGVQLYKELRMLLRATKALLDTSHQPVLDRLQTFAVGAFYGHEEEKAHASCPKIQAWMGYGQLLIRTQANFGGVVASTRSLKHYCQCPREAPLKCDTFYRPSLIYPNGPPASDVALPPSISFHSSAVPHTRLHLTFGTPAKWYHHRAQWNGTIDNTTLHLAAEYYAVVRFRFTMLGMPGVLEEEPMLDIDCTLYRSFPALTRKERESGRTEVVHVPLPESEADKTAWRGEAARMQKAMKKLMKGMEAELPKNITVQDKIIIKSLFDAEPCLACGWSYKE